MKSSFRVPDFNVTYFRYIPFLQFPNHFCKQRAENSLIRRMRQATQDLDRDDGDFVRAANIVKSCAEALFAIRKVIKH